MNNKNILILLALTTVTCVAVGQAVLASPPGPPPTGVANATFNSVTVTPASGVGLKVTGAAGSDAVTATGGIAADKFYNPSGVMTIGPGANYNSADFSGTNYIYPSQPLANYYTKAITGAYTATNCADQGGLPSGGTCWFPVMIYDDLAVGTNLSGTQRQNNLVVDWAGNIYNPGTYNSGRIPLRDNDGVDIYGPLQNPTAGAVEIPDNVGMGAGFGLYTQLVRGGIEDPVTKTLTDQTLTLAGFPDLSLSANPGQVKLTGTLASTLPNSVTVNDPQGFQMEDPATGIVSLDLTAQGGLSNLTANPVTVLDDQGMTVKNTFGTSTLMTLDGSGNLTTTGQLKSNGGIGQIYKVSGPTGLTVGAGIVYGNAGTITCSPGDRILSCGIDYAGSGSAVLSQVTMASTVAGAPTGQKIDSCTVYAYNPTASSTGAKSYAMCFNANGTGW